MVNAPRPAEEHEFAPPQVNALMAKYASFDRRDTHRRFVEYARVKAAAIQSQCSERKISLRLTTEEESKEIPLAAIYLHADPVEIVVRPELFLACIENQCGCNERLLQFVIQHEVGHYLDFFHKDALEDWTTYALNLENLERTMNSIQLKIEAMWKQYAEKWNIDSSKYLNPITRIYHEFFNMCDDTLVNEHSLHMGGGLRRNELATVYSTTLFPNSFQNKPKHWQLGAYILTHIMDTNRTMGPDGAILHDANEQIVYQDCTLLQTHALCTRKYYQFRADKRYRLYERYYLPLFEKYLWEYLEKTPFKKLEHDIASMPRPDGPSPDDIVKGIKPRKQRANDMRRAEFTYRVRRNASEQQSPGDRIADALRTAGQGLADQHGVNQHAAEDFLRANLEIQSEIEGMADAIVSIILRKSEKQRSIEISQSDTGDLSVPRTIQNFPKILRNPYEIDDLYDEKHSIISLKPYPVRFVQDMVIDNSGSTLSFKSDIQNISLLAQQAFDRARQKLQMHHGFSDVYLKFRLTTFGNSARIVLPVDADSEGDVMRAFEKITCNEGTVIADVPPLLSLPDDLPHSILIVTDGFLTDNAEGRSAFDIFTHSSVRALILPTEQGLDISLQEFLRNEMNALINESDPDKRRQIEQQIRDKTDEWQKLNEAVLSSNPMYGWPDVQRIDSWKDIQTHIIAHMICVLAES